MDMILHACFKCGEAPVITPQTIKPDINALEIHCRKCKLLKPVVGDEKGAVKKWNKYNPVKE